MEDQNLTPEENNGKTPIVETTKESYTELMNYAIKLKMEERNESMDMYRAAANEMDEGEMIAMLGKTAISYLELASKSSSSIIDIANSIQKIAYSELDESTQESAVTLEERELFAEMAKDMRDGRRSKRGKSKKDKDNNK
jgi:hypothetical protein|tara:strand:+ start:18263 stop:18682 length:420 start_codon:yes stop_codon:yes gene_type:complete